MKYRSLVAGLDIKLPLSDGKSAPAIYFDNSSTTPPLTSVIDELIRFVPMYSNVVGGQYQKQITTERLFEDTRNMILSFLNADHSKDTVIFLKNTTEAINKLSFRFDEQGKDVIVLSTEMEHYSNDLPWRSRHTVEYVKVDKQGKLVVDDLEARLKAHNGAVKLVTVCGVSNVTGYIVPIYKMAEIAHKYNARIHVDGAQLIPHVPFDMKPHNSSEHIDYITFSAHKMYAPFGIGVLVGPRSTFEKGIPEYQGGRTTKLVSGNSVIWETPPLKEEAGTPNIMGVIALAAAIKTLSGVGMANIQRYESELIQYLHEGIMTIPDLYLYKDINEKETIGVSPFNIKDFPHDILAKALAGEAAVCVRNGNLSAHDYVHRLMDNAPEITRNYVLNHNPQFSGLVRASFGLFNTKSEIDIFIDTLTKMSKQKERYCKKYLDS